METYTRRAVLITSALALAPVSCTRRPREDAERQEDAIKRRISRTLGQGTSRILRAVTARTLVGAGSRECVQPSSLRVCDSHVYICDNNAQRIVALSRDLRTFEILCPRADGDTLRWPTRIRTRQGAIVVSDDDGIKTIDRRGRISRTLRVFYGLFDFVPGPDGTIFLNPRFLAKRERAPLIVVVGEDGGRLAEFGKRVNTVGRSGLEDCAFLSGDSHHLIAAFKHRPIVEVYDRHGSLTCSISVPLPELRQLAALTSDRSYIAPDRGVLKLPRYIAGVVLFEDTMFVLLDLPWPTVMAFSIQGRLTAIYQDHKGADVRGYHGFDLTRSEGGLSFCMITRDWEESITIRELLSQEG